MRSILLVLALAAPVGAVASIPTYSNPMSVMRHAQQPVVFVTFVNFTMQDREVLVGDTLYKIHYNSVMHVDVPVGSVVRTYSDQNSKVNGKELLRVSANDAGKTIRLR